MEILNFKFMEEKNFDKEYRKVLIYVQDNDGIKKITVYDDNEVYIVQNHDYVNLQKQIDLYEIAFNNELKKFIENGKPELVVHNTQEGINLFNQLKKQIKEISHESL